jgi:ABC-2 type transport system ATP-binding protein
MYLRTLRDEDGIAVLVTTHMMEEAEHCDRLAILSSGKLVALGSPAALKQSIGGDVVELDARDPASAETLAMRIVERFGILPKRIGSTLRLEHQEGHRFVAAVAEAFPGSMDGLRVQKPSLEDVFIERTGHRFWHERGAEAEPDSTTREAESHEGFREPL